VLKKNQIFWGELGNGHRVKLKAKDTLKAVNLGREGRLNEKLRSKATGQSKTIPGSSVERQEDRLERRK